MLGNGNKLTAWNYADFYRLANFSAYKVHNFQKGKPAPKTAWTDGHVGNISAG